MRCAACRLGGWHDRNLRRQTLRPHIMRDIVYRLKVDQGVTQDLDGIMQSEPPETARMVKTRIATAIQEWKSSQDLLDRLSQHDYGLRPPAWFHVSRWESVRDENLWRIKIWDLEKQGVQYRVLYVFLPKIMTYVVLGIAPRTWDYKDDDAFGQRIRNRARELFDQLG